MDEEREREETRTVDLDVVMSVDRRTKQLLGLVHVTALMFSHHVGVEE